mmetsp:Transcript_1428/g.2860  ORF Transcript_1428/g.2860 Transcript_1428/m.2860 type:complete len:261 (-) Transcript_1428:34-816(-)
MISYDSLRSLARAGMSATWASSLARIPSNTCFCAASRALQSLITISCSLIRSMIALRMESSPCSFSSLSLYSFTFSLLLRSCLICSTVLRSSSMVMVVCEILASSLPISSSICSTFTNDSLSLIDLVSSLSLSRAESTAASSMRMAAFASRAALEAARSSFRRALAAWLAADPFLRPSFFDSMMFLISWMRLWHESCCACSLAICSSITRRSGFSMRFTRSTFLGATFSTGASATGTSVAACTSVVVIVWSMQCVYSVPI